MAIDSTLAVRSGLVKLMKANAALVALVPKAQIYSQWTDAVPPYPFIRMGPPSSLPIIATCLDGQELNLAIHTFASGVYSGTVLQLPAEDQAGQIGAAIATALDRNVIALGNGKARVRWLGGQLLQDPEESQVFHAVVNIRVRAITA